MNEKKKKLQELNFHIEKEFVEKKKLRETKTGELRYRSNRKLKAASPP